MNKIKKRQTRQPIKLILTVLLLILIWVVLQGAVLIKNQEVVFDEASRPASGVVMKPKPDVIYIELPNAEKIVAIKEDYKRDDSLWRIASRSRPLNDQNYRPAIELANVLAWKQKSNDERSIRSELQEPLSQMFIDAKKAGYELMIGSGFRSSQLQATYYNNFVRTRGQAYADRVSARPGTSEHQLGLAVDLAYVNQECYLNTCFADTGAGKWLAANANSYGFILRYPKGKEEITGYQFEPWHFRYVGKDLAMALHQSGLTLDEAESHLLEARKDLGYKD